MSEESTLDDFGQKEEPSMTVNLNPTKIKIPKSWEVRTIDSISTLVSDGAHQTPEYVDDGIRFLSTKNLQPGTEEFDFSDYEKFITEKEHSELCERVNPEKGDILISKSGTIGITQLVRNDLEFSIFVGLGLIRPKDSINSHFLEQVLNWNQLRKSMRARSPGSTRSTLPIFAIEQLEIPFPSLQEQRKITSVLYIVDRAIEKTEEIIRKSERVRKGLTQEIFTTGYYNHSEYSDVRLGPVKTSAPSAWDVKTIPDYFEIIDGDRGKNYPNGSDFSDQGYCLFLSATNVTQEGLKFDETEFITQEKDEELRNGKLKRGDIIMTTRGTVGNFGLYDGDVDYDNIRINSGMVILRPKEDTSSVEYYYHLFRSGIFQRQINATSYGTAQPQTSVTDIKKMGILEPGEDEKEKISELIEDTVSEIQTQKEYRNQLQSIKRGLMEDLLSGTVRTTDTNIDVPEEITKHG